MPTNYHISRANKYLLSLTIMILVCLVILPLTLTNKDAIAMGPPPGGCFMNHGTVEYAATIKSFMVNNGRDTFDVMAHPDVVIPVIRAEGYQIDFVLHTDDFGFTLNDNRTQVYENRSDVDGLIWYDDTFNGYSQSRCLGPSKGDSDYSESRNVPINYMYPDNQPITLTAITSLGSDRPIAKVTLKVVGQLPGDTNDEQPSQGQNSTESVPPPQENSTNVAAVEGNPSSSYHNSRHHNHTIDSGSSSDYNSSNEPSSTANVAPASNAMPQQETNNSLVISGKVASLYFSNSTAPGVYRELSYPSVLSGNWSMSINDYNISRFDANITDAQIGSQSRQFYQIANFTTIQASSIHLDNHTLSLTSMMDIARNNITILHESNVTITLEKLNVLKIDLPTAQGSNFTYPIYGVINSIIYNGRELLTTEESST